MARKRNPFKLRSGNTSSFKMMGSAAESETMRDHPGHMVEPKPIAAETRGEAEAVMLDSPLSKSDPVLTKDYEKERKAASPYRKEDDDKDKDKDTTVATNESKTDDTPVDPNMSFDVPDPDREDGGFRQDAGDYVPEQGDDLTGTDYTYTDSKKIVRRDDDSDLGNLTGTRDTDVHGSRGGADVREANLEKATEDPDVSWSESRTRPGSGETHSPVTGEVGKYRVDHFDEAVDDQGRSQGAYETHFRTGPGGTYQEERIKESEHGRGNLGISDQKYGSPIAEDPFADNRVIGTDRDGNPIFADTSQQVFGDIYVPSGPDSADATAIGERYIGDWTGYKDSAGRRQKGYTGKYDDIHDNPYGMDWDQHAEDITNRTTTGFNPILGGKYEGGEMKLTTGQGGSGSNLISKKVVKTPDGDRIVEKHKTGKKGSFVRNNDTGELEWRENRRVKSKKDVFNPETQKWERKTYVDGREWTPEYKQELKDAKKKYKGDIKEERKEEKRKKREEHNATKHLYRGMNVNEANTAENKHRADATAMGLSYKEYVQKHLPPPPKDDSILGGGPFGTKEERQQRRKERKEREKREQYDNYYASNQPY